ncbi:MAG: glycosyltransferase [bacterium]
MQNQRTHFVVSIREIEMKVLFVTPAYEPAWAFGGTVTSVSQLCNALSRKGADITVYTTDADGKGGHLINMEKTASRNGDVSVKYFRCNLGKSRAFYSRELATSLKENISKFDLVHVSSIWQWHQIAVERFSVKNEIKYIISPHGSLREEALFSVGNQLIKKMYWSLFVKKAIESAAAISFLNERERTDAKEYVRIPESFIVPNGVDCETEYISKKDAMEFRQALGIDGASILILFLGRVHKVKNIDLVIQAIPFLLREGHNVHFIIAGPIEDKHYYSSLKNMTRELNIEKRVVWYGLADEVDKHKLQAISDLMILPSMTEGVSMSLLEALASSTPVLLTSNATNSEEIEASRAGIIVEPEIAGVRKGLIRLFSEPRLLEETGENARRLALEKYNISNVALLMMQAYEDILSGKRHPELMWEDPQGPAL